MVRWSVIQRTLAWLLLVIVVMAPRARAAPRALVADAVEQQDGAKAISLLAEGADVNAAQVDGMTALHWAVYHDDTSLVASLLDAGADVHVSNRYGIPPLFLACQNGNGEIVDALLGAGADANATLPGGETMLMTAARTGRLGPIESLLAHGVEVNARERKGQTAIMWAAAEGHTDVVDALIAAGADFETPLPSGFTPFFFAVREGRTAVVLRLLDVGVDVNAPMETKRTSGKGPRRGTTALILAVENGHFELAARLLEAGADPNDLRVGYSSLHALTWVRKPLRGDGDPPPRGSGSMTSLELARRLVEHGADINARHGKAPAGRGRLNRTGTTPFLLAAETADLEYMTLLLELGVDPHLRNVDDCTPLLAAAGVGVLSDGDEAAGTEEEAIEAIRFLLDQGADINAVEKNGETAMHGAAYKSWPKLVHFLVEQGADVTVWNQENVRGWTPLLIAEGHRPGNFRPSPATIAAIEAEMRAAGIEPPTDRTPRDRRTRRRSSDG